MTESSPPEELSPDPSEAQVKGVAPGSASETPEDPPAATEPGDLGTGGDMEEPSHDTEEPSHDSDGGAPRVPEIQGEEPETDAGSDAAVSVSNEESAIGVQINAQRLVVQRDSEPSFVDPTVPLPPPTRPRYFFDAEQLRWRGYELEEKRVLAVRSPDDGINAAAADAVIRLERFCGYGKRLLAFGSKNLSRDDLFLENLVGQRLGDGEGPMLLKVAAEESLTFLESMFGGDEWVADVRQAMRTAELLVVVQIPPRYWGRLSSRWSSFGFADWDGDFLRPLLSRHLLPSRVEPLLERLIEQRAKELWGPAEDDYHLFEALRPHLTGESGSLEQAIEERDVEGRQEVELTAVDAFDSGTAVDCGVLFCAAYFPGLDLSEFARLVEAVAGDEPEVVEQRKVRRKKGTVRSRYLQRPLRDAWSAKADEILRRCRLTLRTVEAHRAVAFVEAGDRRALARHIRRQKPIFFLECCDAVWEQVSLFDPEASPELVDGMVQLFVEISRFKKSWKSPGWLSRILMERLSHGVVFSAPELFQRIAEDEFVLARVGRLLRALVSAEEVRELVDSWLQDLLMRKGHVPVLRLAMHLRFAEGFDYLHWLKRFSDESPPEVRNLAYTALYRHARQSKVRIWEFLDELKEWLPEPERKAGRLSNSNRFALQLLVEYAADSAATLDLNEFGAWPAHYPLFRSLAEDPDSVEERLERLLGWLFHPMISAVFEADDETLSWSVRARLIELWSNILLGLEGGPADRTAEEVYRRMLRIVWRRAGRSGRTRLLRTWRSDRAAYLANRRAGDATRARHLDARRLRSRRLERDLKLSRPDRAESTNRDGGAR